MKFNANELDSIQNERNFTKTILGRKYWVKPVAGHSSYPLGSIENHKIYFRILKEYIQQHIPSTKLRIFTSNGKKTLLVIQRHVYGREMRSLRELKTLLTLKQNSALRNGIRKMLLNGPWVIDLKTYKKNFIANQVDKLYYVDGRMPVFSGPSEDRYQLSKKRTLSLLSQTEESYTDQREPNI